MVLDIHHQNARNIFPIGACVYVSDIERSHRWYTEVLGLKMELAPDRQSSLYYEEHADAVRVTVFRLLPGLEGRGRHGTVSLTFQVDDLPKTVAEVRAAGGIITREPSLEPGNRLLSATILDPDGHGIVIFEC